LPYRFEVDRILLESQLEAMLPFESFYPIKLYLYILVAFDSITWKQGKRNFDILE